MADSNGHDTTVSSDRLLPGWTELVIKGKSIPVPPLTFAVLEMCDPEMSSIRPEMTSNQYGDVVLRIAATSIEAEKAGEDKDPDPADIDKTFRRLKRGIIYGEMRKLGTFMDQLMINSGYQISGEAEATMAGAENPGTETSTESSQTLQSGESVAETPSGSKENLH